MAICFYCSASLNVAARNVGVVVRDVAGPKQRARYVDCLLLATAGLPVLVLHAVRTGGVSAVVGVTTFGSSAILLYLASALYHAITRQRTNAIFRELDHAAIFLRSPDPARRSRWACCAVAWAGHRTAGWSMT